MRPGALPLLAAAAITLLVDGWYISILAAQGGDDLGAPRVWFVFAYLAGAALLAGVAALGAGRRHYLASAVAGALLFMGVLTGFTIGQPLLLAGLLALLGLLRVGTDEAVGGERYSRATALAVALLAVFVGVAGLVATQPRLLSGG